MLFSPDQKEYFTKERSNLRDANLLFVISSYFSQQEKLILRKFSSPSEENKLVGKCSLSVRIPPRNTGLQQTLN